MLKNWSMLSVISRLDDCNSLLIGCPNNKIINSINQKPARDIFSYISFL